MLWEISSDVLASDRFRAAGATLMTYIPQRYDEIDPVDSTVGRRFYL